MAFGGAEYGSLDFRLLRQAGSHEVDADVKAERFLLEMGVGFVKESRVLNGQIDEFCERTERHGMPTVASGGTGSNGTAFPFLIASLGIFDGATSLWIDA